MNGHLLLTLLILAAALAALFSDRLRPDLVALSVVVLLGTSGVLTTEEALSGLSNPAAVILLAIFILAEGLQRAGVTDRIGTLLLRLGGGSEGRMVLVVMLAGAFFSLFMNNTAAAAVLLPGAAAAARKSGVSASRLLMPLAFATSLGGMATLFTTTNIVVGGMLQEAGHRGFGLLDFAPLGLPIVAAGSAYMVLWGRRLLPRRAPMEMETRGDLLDVYRLGERLFRCRVPFASPLAGKALAQSGIREQYGLNVVALERAGRSRSWPLPWTVLQAGDVLVLEGDRDAAGRMEAAVLRLLPQRGWREKDLAPESAVVVEAMLAPRSGLNGLTLRGAHFREKYGMTALALWRSGGPIREGLADVKLQFGDALLLQGPLESIPILDAEPDVILLSRPTAHLPPRKSNLAAGIMLGTLALGGLFPGSIGEILLGGALAMVLSGFLSMDQAYRAVDWRSLFLVAGMLPMGLALSRSGAAGLIAEGVAGLAGAVGPAALAAGLFLLAAALAQAMSSTAVAALVAPVAIQAALQAQVDPRALAMAVALGTSTAFLTPLGHPVNVLVMGAGGYKFHDYARAGWPLVLIALGAVVFLLPVYWPLR